MKKITTIALVALMLTGVAFAGEGKKCVKGKDCCKKEGSCKKSKESKDSKNNCGSKKSLTSHL